MATKISDLDHLVFHQRIERLKQYLDIIEGYLRKEKDEFEAKTYEDLGLDQLPEEIRGEVYSEELWYYDTKFPRVLRNSLTVTAHSLLEYELNIICRKLKKVYGIPINCSDLRGDKLEQINLYFKLAGISLLSNNSIWNEINHYIKIRNCIVHTNGLINGLQDKDREAILPYLKNKGIISKDTIEEEIALTEEFCKEMISNIQEFLNNIYVILSNAKSNLQAGGLESRGV